MSSQPKSMYFSTVNDKFWSLIKFTDLRNQQGMISGSALRICVSVLRQQLSIWNGTRMLEKLSLQQPRPTVRSRGTAVVFLGSHCHFRVRLASLQEREALFLALSDFVEVEIVDSGMSQENSQSCSNSSTQLWNSPFKTPEEGFKEEFRSSNREFYSQPPQHTHYVTPEKMLLPKAAAARRVEWNDQPLELKKPERLPAEFMSTERKEKLKGVAKREGTETFSTTAKKICFAPPITHVKEDVNMSFHSSQSSLCSPFSSQSSMQSDPWFDLESEDHSTPAVKTSINHPYRRDNVKMSIDEAYGRTTEKMPKEESYGRSAGKILIDDFQERSAGKILIDDFQGRSAGKILIDDSQGRSAGKILIDDSQGRSAGKILIDDSQGRSAEKISVDDYYGSEMGSELTQTASNASSSQFCQASQSQAKITLSQGTQTDEWEEREEPCLSSLSSQELSEMMHSLLGHPPFLSLIQSLQHLLQGNYELESALESVLNGSELVGEEEESPKEEHQLPLTPPPYKAVVMAMQSLE